MILITRPREDAELFARALREKGFSALVCPMLEIAPCSFAEPDLEHCRGLVFTSAQAVRTFSEKTTLRNLPVFVVGEQTAQTAREKGYGNLVVAEGNAESLERVLLQESSDGEGFFLHVRGDWISYPLGQGLEKKNVKINELVVYTARLVSFLEPVVKEPMITGQVRAVTFFSKRTAQAFLECLERDGLFKYLHGIKALCISRAVSEYVQAYFPEAIWKTVEFAVEADSGGMLDLVLRTYQLHPDDNA
ncbi:MAG: uroporphyrinogen-III synthase [Alphaproteobacteria bacterium]|nr:uroporphyrinogen-III synthase [Alphaproteobacteria bacterium]